MNLFKKECLASTDLAEKPEVTKDFISISKSYLPKGEYFPGPFKKEWLFLHHTAGWHDPYQVIDCWAKDKRGEVATEFVIGGQSVKGDNIKFDGEIVQAFPTGGRGWHLGTGSNSVHNNSVGIEVCNFGQIVNGKTYVNVSANITQTVRLDKPFRGYQHWHKYSDKQIESLKSLILFIAKRDNIDPRVGLVTLIKSKGANEAFDFYDPAYIAKNKGIYSHSNILKTKVDMFPQQELIDMLLSL